MTSASRTTAWTGRNGSRKGRLSSPMSALVFLAGAHEVVWCHRTEDAQFHTPLPVGAQVLDFLVQFVCLVLLHEKGDVHRFEFVRRIPDNAGHGVALQGGQKLLRVPFPLRRDRVVDDLAEPDPFLPGGVGVLPGYLLPEPGGLGVLRQDLLQDGGFDVLALDHVLGPSLEFFQCRGELIPVWFEEFGDDSVLAGHDRAEAQRQDGYARGDRIEDLLMRLQVVCRAQRAEEFDLADQSRQIAIVYQRYLTVSDPLDLLAQLHVSRQDPVHVVTGLLASAGALFRFR